MMKLSHIPVYFSLLILAWAGLSCAEDSATVSGPYLGQAPPGDQPQVFAPGILSKGFHERGLTFSPDGTEAFYAMSDVSYQFSVLVHMKEVNGVWTEPEIASFSGRAKDLSAAFSPDGQRLFFTSRRSVPGDTIPKTDLDIWMLERRGSGWSEPIHLGPPINTDLMEASPSVAANGTLYFQARWDQGSAFDLYYSVLVDGQYQTPRKLPDGVNTTHNESAPFIAPDESYLLFQSNRPGSLGQMDIYVSYSNEGGSWTEPVNLGVPINSRASEFAPRVSPDGKYLFFSSYRGLNGEDLYGKSYTELLQLFQGPQNGYATVYWVDAGIIAALKPDKSD